MHEIDYPYDSIKSRFLAYEESMVNLGKLREIGEKMYAESILSVAKQIYPEFSDEMNSMRLAGDEPDTDDDSVWDVYDQTKDAYNQSKTSFWFAVGGAEDHTFANINKIDPFYFASKNLNKSIKNLLKRVFTVTTSGDIIVVPADGWQLRGEPWEDRAIFLYTYYFWSI